MSPVNEAEWMADYERRRALGQTGWQDKYNGRRRFWPLTPHNARSFDDDVDVYAVGECAHCQGEGVVPLAIARGKPLND